MLVNVPLKWFQWLCYDNFETGRGIFASKVFLQGDFILEYRGKATANEPECVCDTYMYEFFHSGKIMW